jgi:isocitrate dehydrogenase
LYRTIPSSPFIEGDGTGRDIWRASVRVLDARSRRRTAATRDRVEGSLRRREELQAVQQLAARRNGRRLPALLVGIKGPLTTPVGGGIRSLNVALRQMLDLFVCLRPVRWYQRRAVAGQAPEKVDMVIFRENTEDIYAGIEYAAGSAEAQKLLDFFAKEFPKEFKKIRFGSERPPEWQAQLEAIGAPQARRAGGGRHRAEADQPTRNRAPGAQRDRLRRAKQAAKSVTLVHKGNIMKFTEGAFRDWGYRSRRSSTARWRSTAGRGAGFRKASPAPASSSRTRSPTSRCSRC